MVETSIGVQFQQVETLQVFWHFDKFNYFPVKTIHFNKYMLSYELCVCENINRKQIIIDNKAWHKQWEYIFGK